MLKVATKFFIGLMVAALLSVSMVAAQESPREFDRTGWPETFIIGVYPGDDVAAALAGVEPLRAYLEEYLGVRTVLITGTSYNAVIEAMAAGRADAIEVGPFSYVLAADVAQAEAIAVANYSTDLTDTTLPGYFSLFFTKKGSGIRSIEDLAGRSFGFTDPASTSGYLIPANEIMTAMGFTDPAEIEAFTNVSFAGNHPNAVLAVWNDNIEAAGTFDQNLATQVERAGIELCGYTDLGIEGPATPEEWPYLVAMTREEIEAIYDACPEGSIVVFHQSRIIPETPFAIRSTYPDSFKQAVRQALLDFSKDQELVNQMERFYVDPVALGDAESIDGLYDVLRDAARNLNINLRGR
jgi:phosphate/phosphite/phosphonate ABC transporter binding protein